MKRHFALLLLLFAAVFIAAAACAVRAADISVTTNGNETTVDMNDVNGNNNRPGFVIVQGYVSEAPDIRDRPGVLIPVPGAQIYFILNNVIMARTVSNAVGFYAVSLPSASGYTVAVSASGFQTQIGQEDFLNTRSFDIGLTPIPFNGFVPYALYPVLETSPGREVDCTIVVENFQVIDQMVTFTVVTPPEWQAWLPFGEAMMVRSGDSNEMVFRLKYVGSTQGPHIMKIVVNGGAYFAEIPVVVVVKDLPFEEISFWTYAPEKVVKPGDTASFIINAENKYAQDKDLNLRIDKPDGWSVTTGNGTELYVPDGKIGNSYLWVYVPSQTKPGNYTINLTVCGQGVKSNELTLKVRVEGRPMYDAIIKGQNRSAEGYPLLNLTPGQPFDLRVRIYNSWDFPVSIQATAEVGDNWYHYIDGVPNGRVYVEPGKALEFTVKSRVPDGTYGNFTAKVYLESAGQSMTLLALIAVPEPPPPPVPETRHDWEGIALTGATAATFVLTMAASVLRRLK
jgi:hypothetical protein